jgi:hypothetical protein
MGHRAHSALLPYLQAAAGPGATVSGNNGAEHAGLRAEASYGHGSLKLTPQRGHAFHSSSVPRVSPDHRHGGSPAGPARPAVASRPAQSRRHLKPPESIA